MLRLRTLGDFMSKLNKITWSQVDRAIGKVLSSEDGWSLTYSINELGDDVMALQVVIQLRFEGEHVQSWGCESNDENAKFLKWFRTTRYAIQKEIDKERQVTENVGQEKFRNL